MNPQTGTLFRLIANALEGVMPEKGQYNAFAIYDNSNPVKGTITNSLSLKVPLSWFLQVNSTVFAEAILAPLVRLRCQKFPCLAAITYITYSQNPPLDLS